MIKGSKLSKGQILEIMEQFCKDINASKASKYLHLNRNTINRFYGLFRMAIYYYQRPLLNYLPFKKKLKKNLSVIREPKKPFLVPHALIGLKKIQNKFSAECVPKRKCTQLLQIIREQVWTNGYVFLPKIQNYDAVVDTVYNKYYAISHEKNVFLSLHYSFDYDEDELYRFWIFIRKRLLKFNGGHRAKFNLHLKESEWRYKKTSARLEKELKKIFKIFLEKQKLLPNIQDKNL